MSRGQSHATVRDRAGLMAHELPKQRIGLSVLELLIAIVILSILAGLLLIAVQAARESARSMQCTSNLKQLGIALHGYAEKHGMLPPGSNQGVGFHIAILPYIERNDLYDQLNWSLSPVNKEDIETEIVPIYLCPSDSSARSILFSGKYLAQTNYAGNAGVWIPLNGFDGVFRYWNDNVDIGAGPPVRLVEIRDGLSNTIGLSEILRSDLSYSRLRTNWNTPQSFTQPNELDAFANTCDSVPDNPPAFGWLGTPRRGTPWVQGNIGMTLNTHVLTPNRPSCYNGTSVTQAASTAASQHRAGVNCLFIDGHITLVSNSIERRIWRAYSSRSSGDNP